MNYLIAILDDRTQAEAAYAALEKAGLPLAQIAILGRGYKSADEFGLIDPATQARKQSKLMAFWLIPFGFLAGVGFSLATELNTFAWAGEIGNHVVGGLLGAIGGAMGSVVAGGSGGLTSGNADAMPYRSRLNEGKYLVVVRGSERLIIESTPILERFDSKNLQGYIGPEA
jgi:hypothetical protein